MLFWRKIGELPVPTRRYYDFVGWYTEVEGGELLTEDSALPGNDNITLYAHWTRQTATVAFNANEGQCSESSRTVNCGDALGTLPVAQRDYYTFLGWYTDPVNGEQIDEAKLIADTVPLMLYAHWEQKPQKGWTLASAVPEGAQILDRKWSYSLTTYAESTNSSMEGFEQTGNYWSKRRRVPSIIPRHFPPGLTPVTVFIPLLQSQHIRLTKMNRKSVRHRHHGPVMFTGTGCMTAAAPTVPAIVL